MGNPFYSVIKLVSTFFGGMFSILAQLQSQGTLTELLTLLYLTIGMTVLNSQGGTDMVLQKRVIEMESAEPPKRNISSADIEPS